MTARVIIEKRCGTLKNSLPIIVYDRNFGLSSGAFTQLNFEPEIADKVRWPKPNILLHNERNNIIDSWFPFFAYSGGSYLGAHV